MTKLQLVAERPSQPAPAIQARRGEFVLITVFCVRTSSTPPQIFMTASVASSGRMPRPTTARAFRAPTASPTRIVRRMAAKSGRPAFPATVKTAVQRPRLAPSDRSMPPRITSPPPPMITIVMPKASRPSTADCSMTFAMLPSAAKPGAMTAK